MEGQKNLPPTILFIFGGSGDLTNRKLIPALYNLYLDNYLPQKFIIIGAAALLLNRIQNTGKNYLKV